MKHLLAIILLAMCGAATAGPDDIVFIRRNSTDTGQGPVTPAHPLSTGLMFYDSATVMPGYVLPGNCLSIGSGLLDVTPSCLAAKFNTPTGTTAQYVRGDGSLATLPTVAAFSFSLPASRTLAASTSYQATDPSKAAVIYPSYACTNATTVLAASGCTIQVRMGSVPLTCATGTVYYTQSLTVQLGVLLTQASINPVPIFLPTGAYFILCPTTGTFTLTAVEQTAG